MWETKLDKLITVVLLVLVAFACGWRMGINRTKTTLEIDRVTDNTVYVAYTDGSVHMYDYN